MAIKKEKFLSGVKQDKDEVRKWCPDCPNGVAGCKRSNCIKIASKYKPAKKSFSPKEEDKRKKCPFNPKHRPGYCTHPDTASCPCNEPFQA